MQSAVSSRRTGVLVGGSGLIGGTLLNHFKTSDRVDLLSPNSKELSLRVPEDIRSYFERVKPDFVINCAIASLDSDPELTCEVSYLGAVHLARAARELGIPYIHISSAAVLPRGRDLVEDERLPLTPDLPNYAKAKLLAETTLEHMHRNEGLDYTAIRLAIVYGTHDHKIQGFHRLLFAIVDRSLPALLTRRDAVHSYSNARKLPAFVSHVLAHRAACSGRTFHFVDPEPVPLGELMLAIRARLGASRPRAVYVPRGLARLVVAGLSRLVRLASRIGLEARLPTESLFLERFYESQTLSCEALRCSGFVDPDPGATVFSELPELLRYYVVRWERLGLIEPRDAPPRDPRDRAEAFRSAPQRLLAAVLAEQQQPFLRQCSLVSDPAREGGADAPARRAGRATAAGWQAADERSVSVSATPAPAR